MYSISSITVFRLLMRSIENREYHEGSVLKCCIMLKIYCFTIFLVKMPFLYIKANDMYNLFQYLLLSLMTMWETKAPAYTGTIWREYMVPVCEEWTIPRASIQQTVFPLHTFTEALKIMCAFRVPHTPPRKWQHLFWGTFRLFFPISSQ